MATRLILIRHCATELADRDIYCGFTDAPLNERGLKQASQLKKALEGFAVDTVYSSDLKRATETARIALGETGARMVLEPALREMDFGAWDGLSHQEAINRYGEAYSHWLANITRAAPPGGESFPQFKERVLSAFGDIAKKHEGQTVALVSHAGPLSIIICFAMGAPLDNYSSFKPPLGSISEVDFMDGTMRVNFANRIDHLL